MSAPTITRVTPRVATSVAFGVQGLVFAAVLTRVPALKDKFDFTDGELTVLLAVVPVIAGLGSALAGRLAARRDGTALLRRCVVAACLTAATVGWAPTRPALFVALAAYGLALGAVDATMNMRGVAVQAGYGRSLMNGFHAVWSLAGIVGALYTYAVADTAPVAVSITLAAAAGATAILLLRGPATAPAAAAPPDEPGDAAVPWRVLLPIGVALGCVYVADSGVSNWSAVYLRDTLLSAEGVAALGYAAYQGTALVGRLCGDRLVTRRGPVAVVRAAVAVAVLGLLAVIVAPTPAVAVTGFAVLGLGASVLVPLSFSAAGRLDGGRGTAVARVNLFNYAGFLVGAPLVGVVGSLSGPRYGWLGPLLALGAVLLLARRFAPKP